MNEADEPRGHDVSAGDHHDVQREQIGAYALGHLDRREAHRLRRHLAVCPECQVDLADIAPVAQQLERLSPDGARARKDRGRREQRRGFAVQAAALVVAVTIGVLGARVLDEDAQPATAAPVEAVDLRETRDAGGATVDDAGLIDHSWGVELVMTGSGFAAGEVYRVRFLGADGAWAPAGRFVGTGEADLDCGMQSALLRRDAVAVQVLDADDQAVLTAEL